MATEIKIRPSEQEMALIHRAFAKSPHKHLSTFVLCQVVRAAENILIDAAERQRLLQGEAS